MFKKWVLAAIYRSIISLIAVFGTTHEMNCFNYSDYFYCFFLLLLLAIKGIDLRGK